MNNKKYTRYTLDLNRKQELLAICKQYPKMMQELEDMADLKGISYDGMPHGTGTSDRTGDSVVKREYLLKRVKAIRDCAKEAGKDIENQILLSVTQGVTFQELKNKKLLLYEKDIFYLRRQKFLWLLDRRL